MRNASANIDFKGSKGEVKVQPINHAINYSSILDAIGIGYKPYEYYWQVGEITTVQGWILHLSVVKSQVTELLNVIVPLIITYNIPFKIVKDQFTAELLLDGSFGYIHVGKIVSIYPDNDQNSLVLAKKLISLTKSFKGPAIPTDLCLGNIVYTRYGAFNPAILKRPSGQSVKHIYNTKGELVPDPYSIPFSLPSGIPWPFQEIIHPITPKTPKLLNYAYYPIATLKKDIKGDVTKAIYFKRLWQIKYCLIKQGRKNTFSDDIGRDIQDRLHWQYDLYWKLAGNIPLPRVFDYFQENESAYLVMEYIKGVSLSNWLYRIYEDRNWSDLPSRLQLKVLDHLLYILTIIQRLHEKGFIHRDITPDNFLIDKKNRIFLIDMELAWSSHSEKPLPPFQLGTPGYMSPEQARMERPTFRADIYALGALMLNFFTNLLPVKFQLESTEKLKKSLFFFLGDREITDMISNCLSYNPLERPSLILLQKSLTQIKQQLHQGSKMDHPSIKSKTPDIKELKTIIQAGLCGLVNPNLLSPKHRWLSQTQRKEKQILNQQVEMDLYDGWHTGMVGPLWMVAVAKKAGFDIQACRIAYEQSWSYIQTHYFNDLTIANPSLHMGGAGIALALSEGLNSDLLLPFSKNITDLENCFSQTSSMLTLSEGIAGQGIALLQASQWLDTTKTQIIIQSYLNVLVKNQQRDGSWNLPSEKKNKTPLNLNKGISGIIWFLLAYHQKYQDSQAKQIITKALHWLIKQITRPSSTLHLSLSRIEITLLFIKAFEVLKEDIYRQIAVSTLDAIQPRPVIMNFTLDGGLAGLGEVYLEACKVFNEPKWQDRADWIAQLLIHSFHNRNPEEGYWIVNAGTTVTADLFTGNAGILHYLIRYMNNETINHPLWPLS